MAEYASILTETPWTCSAHAKDIWTSPDWELNEKLGSASRLQADDIDKVSRALQGLRPISEEASNEEEDE